MMQRARDCLPDIYPVMMATVMAYVIMSIVITCPMQRKYHVTYMSYDVCVM